MALSNHEGRLTGLSLLGELPRLTRNAGRVVADHKHKRILITLWFVIQYQGRQTRIDVQYLGLWFGWYFLWWIKAH